MAGEFHLPSQRQVLRAEQQHLVLQERLVNRAEQRIVRSTRQVNADDLGAELRSRNSSIVYRRVN